MHIQPHFIKKLKSTILQSRYQAARLANQELLKLYFMIGKMLHEKIEQEKWGAKVLQNISAQLQQELVGLRGFSTTNLKRMRHFYEAWDQLIEIGPSVTAQFQLIDYQSISPLTPELLKTSFSSTSFTHHWHIFKHSKTLEERIFYIHKSTTSLWSVTTLKHHLANQLFHKQGALPNNFKDTLSEAARQKALLTFKDEYLLDFINIEDPDEEMDERMLEQKIVNNVKKFLMSIGHEFSFIGNQHRLIVAENEYFVDLLFYHRSLQCLVAFELKKGKFKPEYLGKMNFYLSALDDMVKKDHEAPSIGIILCKEKNNKIVEYSFRDLNKPMGVAVYKTSNDIPQRYKDVLPDAETLKRLLE